MSNRAEVVPYVVPSTYPPSPEGFARPLGHGVRAVLAVREGQLVHNLGPLMLDDLALASADAAWELALENIERVFATEVKARVFPAPSPELGALILCGASWFAASSIVMPRLHAWARRTLADDILVSIPNPEAMLLFPKGTPAQRAAIRARIRDAEAEHRKPITWELFELTDTGVVAFMG